MAAVTELATIAGIRAACQALALPRASYYRKLHPGSSASPTSRRPPARALRPEERQTVLACLHEERFQVALPPLLMRRCSMKERITARSAPCIGCSRNTTNRTNAAISWFIRLTRSPN